jgi:hypothetical protein
VILLPLLPEYLGLQVCATQAQLRLLVLQARKMRFRIRHLSEVTQLSNGRGVRKPCLLPKSVVQDMSQCLLRALKWTVSSKAGKINIYLEGWVCRTCLFSIATVTDECVLHGLAQHSLSILHF